MTKKNNPNMGHLPKKRGPKGVNRHIVYVNSTTLQNQLKLAWPELGSVLLASKSPEDITQAVANYGKNLSQNSFAKYANLVLDIIQDRRFPQKRSKSQIMFLADSLAMPDGEITPRRCREICAEERKKEKTANRIIRRDYYIECTCGYEGPAYNDTCRKCGTSELSKELQFESEYGN